MRTLSALTSIKILGKKYVIKDNEHLRDMGLSGRVDMINTTIELCPDMPPQERAETLLHEIIHACDMATAVEADALVESQVMRLSSVLYGTLVDAELIESAEEKDNE